ncbi:hypothetical protein VE03_09497 [Pseudogymnoascus sp. 23342-1-I1]|nr:hypothetical protein VE03_09497 [Pseudogymnoascus sp. 23342-1-I1]
MGRGSGRRLPAAPSFAVTRLEYRCATGATSISSWAPLPTFAFRPFFHPKAATSELENQRPPGKDNLNLVKKYFPWLLEAYLELPGEIYRADFSWNLYMYMFGGVYIDLDTDCLRPTSTAFEAFDIPTSENTTAVADGEPINHFAIFGRMGTDESFENSIPNAWMASSPGHPFFLMPPLSVQTRVAKTKSFIYWLFHKVSAEEWTGPAALYRAIVDFNTNGLSKEAAALAAVGPFVSQAKTTKKEIVLLPDHWIYPYDWTVKELRSPCSVEAETFNAKGCKERLEVDKKGGISITYWSHTHSNKNSHAKNIDNISHRRSR